MQSNRKKHLTADFYIKKADMTRFGSMTIDEKLDKSREVEMRREAQKTQKRVQR